MTPVEPVAEASKERGSQHKLSVVIPSQHKRARSPVTVQEWVAALPDHNEEEEERGEEEEGEDDSQLVLGAEAGYESSNMAKLLLQRNKSSRCPARQLQHADTASSLRSHASNLSHLSVSRWDADTAIRHCLAATISIIICSSNMETINKSLPSTNLFFSSVDSVLQSREADPEEILLNLGFGGSEQLSRIPARFLRHKSAAKGITVESFLAKQEDIDSMYEFGFAGYR